MGLTILRPLATRALAKSRNSATSGKQEQLSRIRCWLAKEVAFFLRLEALWDRLRVVAEPGGAVAFASLLEAGYMPASGERAGVLISGAYSTAVDFERRIQARDGDGATAETQREHA